MAEREHGLVAAAALTAFCGALLQRHGVPDDEAAPIAASLVEADLRGVDSHGVLRLPIYCTRLACGAFNPRPRPRVVRETRSTAVLDGDNGMGQIVSLRAMGLALDKAAGGEPAFVAVRGSNHFGAAAYFAEMAVPHGMIGLAMTIGGINHMTPWGGAEALLGNNPFAVAMPAGDGPPLVLDMACSGAARGKVMLAARRGEPIPEGWALDAQGRPTSDAAAALAGFMAPVGGAKGYALTLTIGLLSTMLSGAAFGSEVTHLYDDLERPQNVGHLFAALPVASFEEPGVYARRMEKAAAELRGARRAPGVARIYLPGEREALLKAERLAAGIPVHASVLAELDALGRAHGLALERLPPG